MIKNIVLDMGNVLAKYDPLSLIKRFVSCTEDIKLIYDELFDSEEWRKLDRGTISEEQAQKQVSLRLPLRLHPALAQVLECWHDALTPMDDIYLLVKELKEKGYNLYLLSNTSKRFHTYRINITALELFDGEIISADLQLLKPEKAIYQALFDRFELKPDECFFIDDMPPNIAAAKELGMSGFCYCGDMAELRLAMSKAGINV